MTEKKREFLVLVTPVRSAVDEFMKSEPGWRAVDVVWIKNRQDLSKVWGMKLSWKNVHFLHKSYEIENAKEEIMRRVTDYPVKKTRPTNELLKTKKIVSSLDPASEARFNKEIVKGFSMHPSDEMAMIEGIRDFIAAEKELSRQQGASESLIKIQENWLEYQLLIVNDELVRRVIRNANTSGGSVVQEGFVKAILDGVVEEAVKRVVVRLTPSTEEKKI